MGLQGSWTSWWVWLVPNPSLPCLRMPRQPDSSQRQIPFRHISSWSPKNRNSFALLSQCRACWKGHCSAEAMHFWAVVEKKINALAQFGTECQRGAESYGHRCLSSLTHRASARCSVTPGLRGSGRSGAGAERFCSSRLGSGETKAGGPLALHPKAIVH